MKAITMQRFGTPDVLELGEVPVPVPGPGQVRVRVAAAGVNPLDAKIRAGLVQDQFPVELPAVPGQEVAGTVDEVGEGVEGVAVGDEVLGFADTGAYAEQALATTVVRKPAALGWAEAAALPVGVETAGRVLDELDVRAGETLLVHGAAGAVGQVAVQLAVARGATVVGTAGADNQDRVRELGAVPVLFGEGVVDRVRAAAPQGVDAVLDVAGRGSLPGSVELRGGTSRIVTIADPAAFGLGIAFSAGGGPRDAARLARAAEAAAAGTLAVAVGRTFPLAEAAAAHEAVESGHARGKTVLLVG